MKEENFKKSIEADIHDNIPFQCKIGNVIAELRILIESDPHGDGKGIHAHFHTTIQCPKIKIVDRPEPDRCQVTDETCPFWEPFGGYDRDSSSRKKVFFYKFLHSMTFVELYGTQLVYMIFQSKAIRLRHDLRFIEITRLLMASDSISRDIYTKLEELRKKRNKLAHEPYKYLEFEENELFQLNGEANEITDVLWKKLNKNSS